MQQSSYFLSVGQGKRSPTVPEREAGGVRGGGTPPRKTYNEFMMIFDKLVFSITTEPGKLLSDELGKTSEQGGPGGAHAPVVKQTCTR